MSMSMVLTEGVYVLLQSKSASTGSVASEAGKLAQDLLLESVLPSELRQRVVSGRSY